MKRGFTLIELLIVIGIVAVLAAVVVIVLNPSELLKQTRDAARISDITTLNRALATYQADTSNNTLGSTNTLYISVPDTSATCANLGLPALPSGWSYGCVSSSSVGNTNGTGWLPVNLSLMSSGSPLSNLPIDPRNTTTSLLYYTFTTNASRQYWLTATLESTKYKTNEAATDGGINATRLEAGSDTTVPTLGAGAIGFWAFEEGSGTSVSDSAGGHTATVSGGTWITGSKGGAYQFGGALVVPSMSGIRGISMLVYVNSGQEGTWAYLMDARPGLSGGYVAELGIGAGWNKLYVNGSSTAVTFTSIPKNQWVHLYFEAASTFTDNVYIMSNDGGVEQHQGSLDEVRFYGRTLTADEVMQLYLGTK